MTEFNLDAVRHRWYIRNRFDDDVVQAAALNMRKSDWLEAEVDLEAALAEINRRKNQLENIRHLAAKNEECGICNWIVGEIEATDAPQ